METKLGAIILSDYRSLTKMDNKGEYLNSQKRTYLNALEEVLETYWADWVNETVLDDDMHEAFEMWLETIINE